MKPEILNKLTEYKKLHKFSKSEWNKRHVNPSADKINNYLNSLVDNCIQELIKEKSVPPKIQSKIIKKHLKKCAKFRLDTEEREFFIDVYFQLTDILKIDMKYTLNAWMYGRFFGNFLNLVHLLKKNKTSNTL